MKRASKFVAFLSGVALLALSCTDDCSDGGCGGGGEGECPTLAEGEWQISGDPRVDTLFRAALALLSRLEENEQVTRDTIADLAEALGVEIDPAAPLDESAAAVPGAMLVVVNDAVDYVAWGAGTCVADLPLAHEVAVECLTHFGCDVNGACLPEAGAYPPVACEGECVGACGAACSGECRTPVVDEQCNGTCYGSCNLAAAAECGGDCYGECSASCLSYGDDGSCHGPCEGNCQGICETIHGATCSGDCTGMCGTESTDACVGECHGSCEGECDGDCAGRPFTYCGDETCEYSSDCGSLGGILGWVEARATWVDYEIYWSADAEDDSVAIAELAYEMAALEGASRALIAANEDLGALVGDGDYGVTAIDGLSAAVEGLLDADLAEYDIEECKIPCVIPALEEVFEILSAIGTETPALVEAQVAILSALES
ncbi:MAG: hypothetical protein M0R80_19520 [Proteobacteria bacterium]|jgi:hypothetical protein|nr:hypothetical protein [Pseudomonadota bacterium]